MAPVRSKLSWSVPIALCAIGAILWGALTVRLLNRKPAPAEPMAAAPAAVPPGLPAAPVQPKTPDGVKAQRLATILSEGRVRAENRRVSGKDATTAEKNLEASLEREAQELTAELTRLLKSGPAAWPEVFGAAASTGDLKISLRLGSLMAGAVADGEGERYCTGRLAADEAARTRQVAATALAGGRTADSVTALITAADLDADGGVRLAAVTSLAQRRLGSSQDIVFSIEDALRRRAEIDEDDYVRQVAKNLVEPGPSPAGSRPPSKKPPFPTPPKLPK